MADNVEVQCLVNPADAAAAGMCWQRRSREVGEAPPLECGDLWSSYNSKNVPFLWLHNDSELL